VEEETGRGLGGDVVRQRDELLVRNGDQLGVGEGTVGKSDPVTRTEGGALGEGEGDVQAEGAFSQPGLPAAAGSNRGLRRSNRELRR